MDKIEVNADIVTNGIVYANGPVIIQGIDIHQAFKDVEKRLLSIEQADLPELRKKVETILTLIPGTSPARNHLQTVLDLINTGKNIVEILKFIKEHWTYIGPIIAGLIN